MPLVPAVRTPFTDDQLIAALRAAWIPEMGGEPPNHCIAVLCAQVALETGHGTECWNNNPGNYKKYGPWDWMRLHTTEGYGKEAVQLTCDFASFASLEEGCQQFVHMQWSRWELAWNTGVGPGDPRAYALGLHNQKPAYFTGDPEAYARGCEHYFAGYMKLMGPDAEPVVAIQPRQIWLPEVDVLADTLS